MHAIIRNGDSIVLDRLEIYAATDREFYIQSGADHDSAQLTLTGDAITGRASIFVDTAAGTEAGFARGTRSSVDIRLDADLDVTVSSDSRFMVDASISGSHGITKYGEGTMVLEQANSFTGDFLFREGLVEVRDLGAVGAGDLLFDGGSMVTFGTGAGTISNDIGTLNNGGETHGSLQLGTVTLTGNLSLFGDENSTFSLAGTLSHFRFGTVSLTLDFEEINFQSEGTLSLDAVKLGNADLAQHLFADTFPTKFDVGAVDTNGFATVFRDLDFSSSTLILSKSGAMDVTFIVNEPSIGSPSARFVMTDETDRVLFIQDDPTRALILNMKDFRFFDRSAGEIFVEGTEFDDVVHLPNTHVKIVTGDGNDTVYGGASDSYIALGDGNDYADGDWGDDTFFGGREMTNCMVAVATIF